VINKSISTLITHGSRNIIFYLIFEIYVPWTALCNLLRLYTISKRVATFCQLWERFAVWS